MLDLEKLLYYTVSAQIVEPTDSDLREIELLIRANYTAASPSPILNGKPRMVFINAWMVHEGRNLNGDAFVKEELEKRVNEGLFSPPHAGMIDDDHDFTARGFWYRTNFAFDKAAKKWGIFAQGAIWAWRYPELADRLVAEMVREQKIMVSMSTVPESVEITQTFPGFEGQYTRIHHNPVFFTTSLLTVPPGDLDAKGIADEKQLEGSSGSGLNESRANHQKNDDHKESIIMDDKELEALKASYAQLQQEIADLKVKLTEAEVNLKAVSDIRATVEKELETVKSDLKVYRDKEAAETEKNKAEADKKKFESRLSEVPDVVRENLNKHANKELVLARWKEASDTDWEVIKQGFALAYAAAPTYLSRSKDEGRLPVVGENDKNENTLKNFLRE
jgi:hypothetical protein